jgi:PAS domain S-box-containing protein
VTKDAEVSRPPAMAVPRWSPNLRHAVLVPAAVAGILGLLGMSAWLLGTLDPLAHLTSGGPMRATAAFCVVLLAAAMITLPPDRSPRVRSRDARVPRTLAGLVLVLAVLALQQSLGGLDLGMDRLLVVRVPPGTPPGYVHLVAPMTAFMIALVALGVMTHRLPGRFPVSQGFHLTAASLAGLGLLGYLYGASTFELTGGTTGASLTSTIALMLLAVAGLAADSNRGLVRLLSDDGLGGRVARRFLPAAFVVLPLAGLLRLAGERAGLYDAETGLVLMVLVPAVVLAGIGAWTVAGVSRLEHAREATERERNRLFELSADVLVVLDPGGRVVAASPSSAAVLGSSSSSLVGLELADLVGAQGSERVGSRGGERQLFETRWRLPDGTLRWIEWSAERDEETGRTYAVGRDVTMRKEVADATARLAAIVESSSDAIIGLSPDGQIETWNDAATGIFGYPQDAAVGRDISLIAAPDDAPVLRERIESARAGAVVTAELLGRRGSGAAFPMELAAFPVRTRDGALRGLSLAARDVTDSHAARARLERYAEDLARSNAELEQFAYVASHDLQEPLRMVTGFMGLLQKRYGGRLGSEADEYISFAVEGARRMQGLINDLLAYSRVGTRPGTLQSTDLAVAAREALANLGAAIDEAGAEVRLGPLPEVEADRRQMTQLFQNLVGNAIKFRGDRTPIVEIGAEHGPDEWRIFVRDNGIGIDPGHQEQIFVIFRRLHARDEFPGSGIGLAICKKIVERHGGRIWVDSESGAGATFWFALPETSKEPTS